MAVDQNALHRHLQKCEIEYVASHSESGETIDWLVPYCGSTAQIAQFLRSIGFRVAEILDEEPWPGEKHRWVVTTSGVVVYANQGGVNGLVTKSKA